MKPIGACIFVVSFLMIFASLVRFYVFVMPPGGSKMSAVDVSIVPYQWLGWSPNYREVLTPVQLLPRLQNDDHHHHHTQSATKRTTTPQTSLAMDQEEKKQGQSIRDQLKGHSFQTTNNRAHIVRQYESGSTASDRKTTRETPDRKGITFSLFRLEDLRQYFVRKLIIAVSVCILLAIILLCSIVSQLVRSSTRPSASQQVEIVQRILLSLCDDFAAATFDNSPYERIKYQGTFRSYEETKKPPPKAPKRVQIGGRYIYLIGRLRGGAGPTGTEQCVGQDQSGYDASNYENERTREQGDPEEINATITLPAIMRHYGRRNRQDAAASLAISVSTFKRKCREFGIERWPDVRRIRVKKPPDQHGEGNTSTARQTPSHHVQTGMGGEPVGENREANVLRQDFMGGPIALNIESGLIMVARPPYQHGEKNTSTACEVPSHNVETGMEIDPVGQNQEANVFRRDFTEGPTALNTENVSVSTLKRICRWFGIKRWPNIIRRKKAGRPPPDQYGEKNPSPTWKMLSTNGQTEMGNQMVGHLEETNEFLRDFVEGPHGGVSSEWAFEQNNQWTVSTSYPNSNGPEVPHPHIASTQILGENMESLGDRRNSFGSLEEHLLQGHNSGSMWTVPPCSDPVSSQHMPTITPTMGSSEDRINSLAFVEDVFLAEDDSGSIRWTIPTCFEPAPSQLMPTVPQTTGITDDLRNLLPSVEESFSAGHVSGFINRTVPSCSYPALSQPMSTVPHTTGSSDDLRNFLASVKEPIWAGHVSESINLTVPSCSDPPPSQSMPSILHTMPTNPRMMPLLIERQDTRSVNLKATYGDTTIKFQFPLTSGINELKEEVSKILECKLGSFNIEYKDEDGDWILMARDENVREYLQLLTSLGNQVTKLKVRDKVSDTTNF